MNPEQQQQLQKQLQGSQLIPKFWRPKSSRDLIHEFFAGHLQAQVPEGNNLEIEIRLGRSELYKRKKGTNP
jgi:hypothetical protein